MRKRKILEDLTANEILELYRKSIRKSFTREYRIPCRLDKDNYRKSFMSRIY